MLLFVANSPDFHQAERRCWWTCVHPAIMAPAPCLLLLELCDSNGNHPLLFLIADELALSLMTVGALACTCRTLRPTFHHWLSSRTTTGASLTASVRELWALVRLAQRLPSLAEIHVIGTDDNNSVTPIAATKTVTQYTQILSLASSGPVDSISLECAAEALDALDDIPMSTALLCTSGAGKTLNAFKRHLRTSAPRATEVVAARARTVLDGWKAMAATPGSRGGIALAGLRSAAASGGAVDLNEALAGVGDDAARFALTLMAARFAMTLTDSPPSSTAQAAGAGASHYRHSRHATPSSSLSGWPIGGPGPSSGAFALRTGRYLPMPLLRRSSTTLSCERVGDKQAAVLGGLLASGCLCQLVRLNLSTNSIGDTGVQWISRAIASGAMRTLQYLNLSCNRLGDSGLAALAASLRGDDGICSLPQLSALNLAYNKFETGGLLSLIDTLAVGDVAPRMEDLSLRSNRLTSAGLLRLAGLVASDALPRLRRLRIDDNHTALKAACAKRKIVRG